MKAERERLAARAERRRRMVAMLQGRSGVVADAPVEVAGEPTSNDTVVTSSVRDHAGAKPDEPDPTGEPLD